MSDFRKQQIVSQDLLLHLALASLVSMHELRDRNCECTELHPERTKETREVADLELEVRREVRDGPRRGGGGERGRTACSDSHTSSGLKRVARDIGGERGAQEQDCLRGLLSGSRAVQGAVDAKPRQHSSRL